MGLLEQFLKTGKSGNEFRGITRWLWNDSTDAAENSRQMKYFTKAGLGGILVESSNKIFSPHTTPERQSQLTQTIIEGRSTGLQTWLADDDRSPSGFMTPLSPELSSKRLVWEFADSEQYKPFPHTLATYLVGDTAYRQVEPKAAVRKVKANERILHFYYIESPATTSHIDALNAKAVKLFINTSHESIKKYAGKFFKTLVPGIFTNEAEWPFVPWSVILPAEFKKAHRYDLFTKLPLLVVDNDASKSFRYDYFSTATALFVASFTKQLNEWCTRNKVALTGRLGRLSLDQLTCFGAAMPHYEYMTIPCVEHQFKRAADVLTCKQASSVAHQMGGRRVMAETFGGTGWNVSLEELRWIAETQMVLGVDMLCPHASLYTVRGPSKRSAQPSFNYQQPWWQHYGIVSEYLARLSFILTRGRHVANILVLHNIESTWAEWRQGEPSSTTQFTDELACLGELLLANHYDFDFGDETMLGKYGRAGRGALSVKSCKYKVVIVPRCTTIREKTLKLLDQFMRLGGKVILAGEVPAMVNGVSSDKPAKVFAKAIKLNEDELVARLAEIFPKNIRIEDKSGDNAGSIFVQYREIGSDNIFFLSNRSKGARVEATVSLPVSGRVERWDPETGAATPLPFKRKKSHIEISLTFEPMGSHLIVVNKSKRPATIRAKKPVKTFDKYELHDAWITARLEPNAITLDKCSYRIGKREWSPKMSVQKAAEAINSSELSEYCEVRYTFTADFWEKLPQFIHLAIEKSFDSWEIIYNGLLLTPNVLGWWRDISFKRLNLTERFRPQDNNDIVLRRLIISQSERLRKMNMPEVSAAEKEKLRVGVQLENIYIIGDFSVQSRAAFEPLEGGSSKTGPQFVLTDRRSQTTAGNLITQGMPFFAGTVRLAKTFIVPEKSFKNVKQAVLSMAQPDAIVTKVTLNGTQIALRAWRPFEMDITENLLAGRNELVIELTGSCRNIFGPHHQPCSEQNIDHGMFYAPEHPATEDYCFVNFGLNKPVVVELKK